MRNTSGIHFCALGTLYWVRPSEAWVRPTLTLENAKQAWQDATPDWHCAKSTLGWPKQAWALAKQGWPFFGSTLPCAQTGLQHHMYVHICFCPQIVLSNSFCSYRWLSKNIPESLRKGALQGYPQTFNLEIYLFLEYLPYIYYLKNPTLISSGIKRIKVVIPFLVETPWQESMEYRKIK